MINPTQGFKFPRAGMHTSSVSINLKPAPLTCRLPFLTSSFSQAIHRQMDEHCVACWCQRTTCPWPITQWEQAIQLKYKQEKKLFKKWMPQKKKYFDFVSIILKHLIKVLISPKCGKSVQSASRFHLIKNAFIFGSLWFYLLPLSHPFHIWNRTAEGVQTCLNIPTTPGKKMKKNLSSTGERKRGR